MKRVVLYIRVSTDEQIKGFSIQEQKSRLIAYCKAKGWVIVKIFVDPGMSGATLERPGITTMVEYIEKKKCDIVLVYKLDRLSRSQKDTLYLLEDVFIPHGVDFVSVQESFDTSTDMGRFMLSILSAFAQLERSTIAERTMMGRAGRAKKGLFHGGGTDPIGYDYIDGELEINKKEADQVRMVFEMYAAGHSLSCISEKMEGYTTKHGDWKHSKTIGQVLDNELYNGTIHFEGVRTPDSHDKIISDDLFKSVRRRRQRLKLLGYSDRPVNHLLTGMVHCKKCGARYFARKNPNGTYRYTCHSRAKVNKKMIKDPECKNRIWGKEELEQKIESEFLLMAQNPDSVRIKKTANEGGGKEDEGYAGIMSEIRRIDNEIDNLMNLYASEKIPVEVISDKIDMFYNKRKILLSTSENLGEFDHEVKINFPFESAKLLIKDAIHSWKDYGLLQKHSILRELIDDILIDEGNVYIRWSFSE